MDALLNEWGLSQYIGTLVHNEGYDDIEDCTDLSLHELKEMGFKPGHAKKLQRKINEFIEKNNDENNENPPRPSVQSSQTQSQSQREANHRVV